MKTKKILSVLLALLMTLSLGVIAFADDGYNWTSIPTSPDGLNDGDYYLDFDWMRPSLSAELSPAELDRYLATFAAGEFYLDYDAIALKGTVTFSAAEYGTDQDSYLFLNPGDGQSEIYLSAGLREVGLQWTEVSKTETGLQEGDWYFDVNAMTAYVNAHFSAQEAAALLSEMNESLALPEYVIYVNPGSRLMKYRWGVSLNAPFASSAWHLILPLAIGTESDPTGPQIYMDMFDACIKQYHAPQQPAATDPDENDDQTQSESPFRRIMKSIAAFFLRVVEFIKKVFGK